MTCGHTSATLSIAAGTSTRELMARMGHSSSAAAPRYQGRHESNAFNVIGTVGLCEGGRMPG
jgi:hypothetical protein